MPLDRERLEAEVAETIAEFGEHPYGFFWVLGRSDNPHLDLDAQNTAYEFVKGEPWHDLDLSAYRLWAVSDNGDLLWWDGARVVAMNPRDGELVSVTVRPRQFMRLVGLGKTWDLFPSDLLSDDS